MKEMTRRPRQDEAAWRSLLARHAESGLSTGAFCAEAGVSSKSFYRWRSRLSDSTPKPVAVAATSGKASVNGFIDLGGLHTPERSRVEVHLDLGGGVMLHLVRE